MIERFERQQAPSIQRAIRHLSLAYQTLIAEHFQRILPVLQLLLAPRDILERNRTWSGTRPKGKKVTRYLSLKWARQARTTIHTYAAQHDENADELWQLCRAYFRYGPIGLVDALSSELPPLIPDALQECADFHRLAKQPRSDAGLYIRELLDEYAGDLSYQRLPVFVARYAWATDRKIEGWFYGESDATEHVAKRTRRLNLDEPYPHQRWLMHLAALPLSCILSQRHPIPVEPWLTWISDEHTSECMGARICPTRPTAQDLLLTYRWSIWHYGAPWWKARGVPDTLVVPAADFCTPDDASRALRYLHCNIQVNDAAPNNAYLGLPDDFTNWLADLAEIASARGPTRPLTLAEITDRLMDYLRDSSAETFAVNPPRTLIEQGVSLPWQDGIAATLLLPSAGEAIVREGNVWPFGVPFDAAAGEISDGQLVDMRYDPIDVSLSPILYQQLAAKGYQQFAAKGYQFLA